MTTDKRVYVDLISSVPPQQGPAHFGAFLHRLTAGQNLTYHEAHTYMTLVLAIDDPRQRSAQLAVLLNGLMAKHPTIDEATGVIDAAFDLDVHRPSARLAHPFAGEVVVGIAGSGKKGIKTPNISTPAALVAAAAGVKVAKCASGATSSAAGSADTLKNVGVRLTAQVPRTLEVMAQCGLGVFEIERMIPRFDAAYGGLFFAPHVLSLGFPALLLPVRTETLLYGIAHPDVDLSLEVLRRYHDGDMLVASSTPDNMHWVDEVGIIGETSVVGVRGGERGRTRRLTMAEILDVGPYAIEDIATSGTADDLARIAVDLLAGRSTRALADMVAVNAATLIFLGSSSLTILAAFDLARQVLASGAALEKLKELIRVSGGDDAALRRWL